MKLYVLKKTTAEICAASGDLTERFGSLNVPYLKLSYSYLCTCTGRVLADGPPSHSFSYTLPHTVA